MTYEKRILSDQLVFSRAEVPNGTPIAIQVWRMKVFILNKTQPALDSWSERPPVCDAGTDCSLTHSANQILNYEPPALLRSLRIGGFLFCAGRLFPRRGIGVVRLPPRVTAVPRLA
jgi:hypothetical protein